MASALLSFQCHLFLCVFHILATFLRAFFMLIKKKEDKFNRYQRTHSNWNQQRYTLSYIWKFCQITIKRMKKKKNHPTQIASVTKHFHKRVFTLHVMNAQLLLDKEAEANKLSITIVNGLLRSILLTSFWKIKHFGWMKVIWNTIVSLIFFHLCSFFSISSLCAVSRSVCMANRLSSGKLFCQSDHRYYCRQRSLHLCNIRFNPFKII